MELSVSGVFIQSKFMPQVCNISYIAYIYYIEPSYSPSFLYHLREMQFRYLNYSDTVARNAQLVSHYLVSDESHIAKLLTDFS
jgi:hypothetical protein